MIPIPEKIDEALAEIVGDISYSREGCKKDEEQFLREELK